MIPLLGNVAGLWALLGIPAIIAIHFLQQRSRVVRTSTWFLIEKLAPDSARGRTWDRLRASRAFWLQLASVLVATWVIVEPRWVRSESAQTIVVVLDASVSMDAFRDHAISAAEREFRAAEGLASHTTWVVMTTNPREPALYRGTSREAASAALQTWHPELGEHDPAPALRLARGIAGASGRSLFITDTRANVAPDQRAVGIGYQIDNVGFAGSSVVKDGDRRVWHAFVKNSATTAQHRTWHVEVAGASSPDQSLDLAPDALTEISAPWPDDVDQLTVVLSPDAFASDDRLPLVRPAPKPLVVAVEGTDDASEFFRKVARSVEGVQLLAQPRPGSLRLARLDQIEANAEPHGGIFWPNADQRQQISLMTEPVVPERDPLVAGLNWQGWIGSGPTGFPATASDLPLLWQDRWPLMFLRPATAANGQHAAHGRKLMLAFDWGTSNAGRLPAMVLLAERFLADERDAQDAPYSANFDGGALIPLTGAVQAGPLTLTFQPAPGTKAETRIITAAERSELRAPGRAGTFTLKRGDELLVRGATQFPDPRQGNFRAAATFANDVPSDRQAAVERNTLPDPFAPGWLVLLAALVLGSWWTKTPAPEPGLRQSKIENPRSKISP